MLDSYGWVGGWVVGMDGLDDRRYKSLNHLSHSPTHPSTHPLPFLLQDCLCTWLRGHANNCPVCRLALTD